MLPEQRALQEYNVLLLTLQRISLRRNPLHESHLHQSTEHESEIIIAFRIADVKPAV
jgi:hypothetical protein